MSLHDDMRRVMALTAEGLHRKSTIAAELALSKDAEVDALRAEVERLRANAERYQYLRGGKARTKGAPKPGRIEVFLWEDRSEGALLKGDALDSAVDAARASAPVLGAGGEPG